MDISMIVDMTNNHPRPAQICRELLNALEASEGRRKRRKRDTTPDAIGLEVKRDLLERAVAADPEPDALDRKSTRLNSSHLVISYAVFCLKKKKKITPCSERRHVSDANQLCAA